MTQNTVNDRCSVQFCTKVRTAGPFGDSHLVLGKQVGQTGDVGAFDGLRGGALREHAT